jgi:hypothetical protein
MRLRAKPVPERGRRTRAWGLRVLLSGLGTGRYLCPETQTERERESVRVVKQDQQAAQRRKIEAGQRADGQGRRNSHKQGRHRLKNGKSEGRDEVKRRAVRASRLTKTTAGCRITSHEGVAGEVLVGMFRPVVVVVPTTYCTSLSLPDPLVV